MIGKYNGTLVGFRTYDKAVDKDGGKENEKVSVTNYVYDVFCTGGRKDNDTGLYKDKCEVVSIVENEQVLPNLKYGLAVEFYGEEKRYKDKFGNEKSYIAFSDITPSAAGGAK